MNAVLHLLGRQRAGCHPGQIPTVAFRVAIPVSALMAAGLAGPADAADKFYMTALPTAQQTVRYNNGEALLFDQGNTTIVSVMEVAAPNGRLALDIAVMNRGRAPINLGPENIQISTDDGKIIPIISYEQLIAKEEKLQKRQRFRSHLVAAVRGLSTIDAGNVRAYGTYSTGYSMVTYNITYHDPVAAAAEEREVAETNAAVAEALAIKQARNLASYNTVLRTTTIDPGAITHGTIQFDIPKDLSHSKVPVFLHMVVTLNNETHNFAGQLQKSGK